MSEGGGNSGGVTGDKAAMPVSANQVCVSAFVGIFKETSGRFPAVFAVQNYIFDNKSDHLQSENRYIKGALWDFCVVLEAGRLCEQASFVN